MLSDEELRALIQLLKDEYGVMNKSVAEAAGFTNKNWLSRRLRQNVPFSKDEARAIQEYAAAVIAEGKPGPKMCEAEGCNRVAHCRRACKAHYARLWKYGDPAAGRPPVVPAPERVWLNVVEDSETGCWLWSGSINVSGYGTLSVDNRDVRAHRYVYELLVTEIPEGLQLDHLCRVRHCVNPWHLEPVTTRINTQRGFAARKQEYAA